MIQQQYLTQQQLPRVVGRVFFLASNLLNMLFFALTFYKCVSDQHTNWPVYIQILLAYLTLHNLFGVICAIDQDTSLLANYKISSYIVGAFYILTVILSIIGCYIFSNSTRVGDSLTFLLLCFILIIAVVEVIICYTNIKYIGGVQSLIKLSNQPLASSSLLQFSNSNQFLVNNTLPQSANSFQYPLNYVIQYPQQQFQQTPMVYEQKPQVIQPMSGDIVAAQTSAHKYPLILQNGYSQFQ